MIIPVELGKYSYDIVMERGASRRAGEIFNLDRKVMLVADENLPPAAVKDVAAACREVHIFTVRGGEAAKNLAVFEQISASMLKNGFDRGDCVLALGGGVTGDLAGFVAACYMRGVDFYNIPTTLLAQVDSSIGGKTAVDLGGIKNIIGAFHQPRGVIVDQELLASLDQRQMACGAAEIIKIAAALDEELLALIEEKGIAASLAEATARAIRLKAGVIEKDEKESGLRRVLNFGHTLGHGIEAVTGLFHGECVALGMLPMSGEALRARLTKILAREGLPVSCRAEAAKVVEAAMHDKKARQESIITVQVKKAGEFEFVPLDSEGLLRAYNEVFA